jgi:hypothetical protein
MQSMRKRVNSAYLIPASVRLSHGSKSVPLLQAHVHLPVICGNRDGQRQSVIRIRRLRWGACKENLSHSLRRFRFDGREGYHKRAWSFSSQFPLTGRPSGLTCGMSHTWKLGSDRTAVCDTRDSPVSGTGMAKTLPGSGGSGGMTTWREDCEVARARACRDRRDNPLPRQSRISQHAPDRL